MARKTQRNRRRGPVKDTARASDPQVQPDRYEKYLPGWMKDGKAPVAMRAAMRSRRPRQQQQRAPGGYTPGKYALDGSETRNAVMMGRGEPVESSRARWEGATLVIVTTFRVEDRAAASPFTAELTRRLHLESPTTLVVDVTRGSVLGGPQTTTRAVYRKAAQP